MRQNSRFYALGTCAVVSAFGTAIVLPAMRQWTDPNIVLWLCYVLAAGVTIGGGKSPISTLERAWVSSIPGLSFLLYAVFRTLILGQTMGLSSVMSDNPRFWVLLAFVIACTWSFAFLFSFSRAAVELCIGWLMSGRSRGQIKNIARAISALIALASVVELLLNAVGLKH